MSAEPVFSRRVLISWIAAAFVAFTASAFFMTREGGSAEGHDTVGPSTFSRSAIGHAGFAEILHELGVPVVKSQFSSREKLSAGSVLVIAEPSPTLFSLEALRPLLDAKTVLFILPKRVGKPSDKHPEWLGSTSVLPQQQVGTILSLAVPQAKLVRQDVSPDWTVNRLGPKPSLTAPVQLMQSDRLRPIVGSSEGMLVGAIESSDRRLWVLSDPDIIANHGIGQPGNAEFGVALIDALRADDGRIVFDETVHGFVAQPTYPLKLLFTFPYVFATLQGLIAIALLLWATLSRFGPPEPVQAALRSGKRGLIESAARLLEFAGHQNIMVKRYVEATIRDVARQLHAPSGLAGPALIEWMRRIGETRKVALDCGAIYERAVSLTETHRPDPATLVPIARDIHRWKGMMLDEPEGNFGQR